MLEKDVRSFRQHLKSVLRTRVHRVENRINKVEWYQRVEQVGHRVDENDALFAPLFRLVYEVSMESEVKAVMITPVAGGVKSIRHHCGITVLAA